MDDRTALVRELWNETPTLVGAILEVSEAIARAHTRPGQYIVLEPNAHTQVFMAIASGPGAERLELLVGPAARAKLELRPGARIPVAPPAGPGYPIELALGKNLLLFAVGSGMSAIRSVIEHVRKDRARYGNVTLYAGAKSPDEHAYLDEEKDWLHNRIDIVRAVSQPWVQDIFRRAPRDVENSVAFVCGMKPMVAGVTDALVEAGMPPDMIRQNF